MPEPQNIEAAPRKRAAGLYTIIAIKLAKGLLLLLISLGIFSLIGQDLDFEFDRFLRWIHLDPSSRFFDALGKKIEAITPANLRYIASGTLLYALLLFVEGGGLLTRSWWAMWLAISETAFFVPLEVFDLIRHFSWTVLAIMVVNIAIVTYLVRNRNRLFHHHHPPPEPREEPESP